MDILAGAPLELQWDEEAKDFKAANGTTTGPIFTIASLDYFTAQTVLGEEGDDEKVRACIMAGLIKVDGKEDAAAEFKARPRARLVNPLFNQIWQHTWGN